MLAGFLVTGGCTAVFGAALRQALRGNATDGAGPGPALIQGAGLLTVAAGLLRRDHLLLNAPGEPGASWHSHAHDAISGLVYVGTGNRRSCSPPMPALKCRTSERIDKTRLMVGGWGTCRSP
jgi:hypothetical protein